jgi:TIR domain
VVRPGCTAGVVQSFPQDSGGDGPTSLISYAREDIETPKRLAAELEVRGWPVFWDRRILQGAALRRLSPRNLAATKCVIALWSRASNDTCWVQEEARGGEKAQDTRSGLN